MTSEQQPHKDTVCYTDYALQEFVLERLADGVKTSLEDHLQSCEACQAMEHDIRLESLYFQQLSTSEETLSAETCIDESTLSAFFDSGLDPQERETIEEHLCVCAPCRRALSTMYSHVSQAHTAIASVDTGVGTSPVPVRTPDLVLTMKPRDRMNPQEHLPRFPIRETGTDA